MFMRGAPSPGGLRGVATGRDGRRCDHTPAGLTPRISLTPAIVHGSPRAGVAAFPRNAFTPARMLAHRPLTSPIKPLALASPSPHRRLPRLPLLSHSCATANNWESGSSRRSGRTVSTDEASDLYRCGLLVPPDSRLPSGWRTSPHGGRPVPALPETPDQIRRDLARRRSWLTPHQRTLPRVRRQQLGIVAAAVRTRAERGARRLRRTDAAGPLQR